MRILEKLGISLSMACAVHCMAMPVALAFLPSLGDLVTEELELLITLSSLFIAVFVLGKDIRLHKNPLPILILLVSFGIILLGLATHKTVLLDILGIVGILSAYLLNWYKLRKVKACACA
jgi:hypothetical protein